MKKIIAIVLAALMLAGSTGCSMITREAAVETQKEPDIFAAEPLAVPSAASSEDDMSEDNDDNNAGIIQSDESSLPTLAEDDPLYEPVMHMYDGLIPIFSYFAFEGKDYDLTSLEPGDFWLFLAMIAASVNEDKVDHTGDISLSWDELDLYADAFFPAYFAENGIPDWRDSYSAYSDPSSQYISLNSISVDGYEGSMKGFWESEEHAGCYETVLEISWSVLGEDDSQIKSTRSWTLVLEPVEAALALEEPGEDTALDEGENGFAFRLISYEAIIEE